MCTLSDLQWDADNQDVWFYEITNLFKTLPLFRFFVVFAALYSRQHVVHNWKSEKNHSFLLVLKTNTLENSKKILRYFQFPIQNIWLHQDGKNHNFYHFFIKKSILIISCLSVIASKWKRIKKFCEARLLSVIHMWNILCSWIMESDDAFNLLYIFITMKSQGCAQNVDVYILVVLWYSFN